MRPFYLLIEEVNREFLSRLLIAREASARGHPVVVGQQWWMAANFSALPPGVVLFKGNNRVQGNFMREAQRAGHRVASIDEEAFVSSSETEIAAQYDPSVEPLCDLFLVQGEFQGTAVGRKFPSSEKRIMIAGNPRADLLMDPAFRPDDPLVNRYREEHGRFLLVNTNFTTINPKFGDVYTYFQVCSRLGVLDDPIMAPMDRFLQWCNWERANFRAIIHVVKRLAGDLRDQRIVLRPHPSEKAEIWREMFHDDLHVDVIADGDHLAWIDASDLLLHSGCSTGLEAYLLGSDAISLTPGDRYWKTPTISNIVNPVLADTDAAVERVQALLQKGSGASLGDAHDISDYLFIDPLEKSPNRIVRALAQLAETVISLDQAGSRQKEVTIPASERMIAKAFISLPEVRRRLRLIEAATGRRIAVPVKEIGPAVFQLAVERNRAEA